MNSDELKSAWKGIAPPAKTKEEIKLMLQENRHPVLKGIRKQLTIELLGWSAFLLCYYTMFDGATRPLSVNAILVTALVISIAHTLYGYALVKYPGNGAALTASLEKHISRIKLYAIGSLISRMCYAAGLLLFFTYSLEFTTAKYYSLAAIILVFFVQLAFLYRIWAKRLKGLSETFAGLS